MIRRAVLALLMFTALPAGASEPAEIAFIRRDGAILDIYRVQLDGSKPVLVFRNDDAVNANSLYPHWNGKGDRILFSAMRNGAWQTLSVDRDGQDVIVELEEPRLSAPADYPEGLSMTGGSLSYTPKGGKRIELYHHRLDRHRDDDAGADEVSWSPDHGWVLLMACEQHFAPEPCHIFVVRPDGTGLKDIAPGESLSWRP